MSRGTYRGRVTVAGRTCRGCVLLTVSRDARRFVRSSFVGVDMRTQGLRCSDAAHLAGPIRMEPLVRIDATGAFRSVTRSPRRSLTVTARFSAGGRRVTGRLVVEDTRPACAQELAAGFTARLASRPSPPPPEPRPACRPVIIPHPGTNAVWDTVEIHGQEPDCTMGKDTALRWHDEAACQDLAIGASCQAGAMLCTAIDRGERDPSAQATCTADGVPPIELVVLAGCRAPFDLTVQTVRLGCDDARDVARSWVWSTCSDAYKSRDLCRLPTRTCSTRIREYSISLDYISRCRVNRDRRQAVAITWHTG